MYKIHIDSTQRKIKSVNLKKDSNIIMEKKGENSVVVLMRDLLRDSKKDFSDISEVTFEPGPGSFTGLKIGSAVANTINWALKLKSVKEQKFPQYGSEPNIQPPKSL